MRTRIIAHRGFHLSVPENTVAAFRAAVAMGADGIETDVQMTKDGHLVIHHNYSLDRSSKGHDAIAAMTLGEIRMFNDKAAQAEMCLDTTIPTLAECLKVCGDLELVNIELKAPIDHTLPYVERVVEVVKAFGYTDRIIISAFDHELLKQVKLMDAGIKVGVLTMPVNFTNTLTFKLLCRYLPQRKPLLSITNDDIPTIPADELGQNIIDIPGSGPSSVIAELAHQIGSVYPNSTLPQVADLLSVHNDLPQYIECLDFQVDFLHCHYSTLLHKPELVLQLKERNILCSPWTPDKPEELSFLAGLGCYSIITNRPDLLKTFL